MNHHNSATESHHTHSKRNYSRIPLKKKIALIKLVYRRARPLDQAIHQLNLKKTTAVNIIKKFKETGSLPMRKFKKSRPNFKKQTAEPLPSPTQDSHSPKPEHIKLEEDSEDHSQLEQQPLQVPTGEPQPFYNGWTYIPLYFYSYM